jgi:hypothetical protein
MYRFNWGFCWDLLATCLVTFLAPPLAAAL